MPRRTPAPPALCWTPGQVAPCPGRSGLSNALYRDCPALRDNNTRENLIREATGPLFPFLQRLAEEFPAAVRPLHPAYDIVWTTNAESSKN